MSKVGVIIIGLSKAFVSLNHDLLLAKLEAYGLDNIVVSFMRSYLPNRLQRCKINNSCNVMNGRKCLLGSHEDLY